MGLSKDDKRAEVARILCKFSEDARVLELLAYAVGRALEKSDVFPIKLTSDQRQKLTHVADWLTVSLMEGAPWLERVDDRGRPLKLMKFSDLDAAAKEADKSIRLQAQKARGLEVKAGDEEIYAELGSGYYLVRLLTPAALDAESGQMQHCIGGGSYDGNLDKPNVVYLSLRDPSGKPHATLEVAGEFIKQCQGKQNRRPGPSYIELLAPYFVKRKWHAYETFGHPDVVLDMNYGLHFIHDLPDGFASLGDLDLSGRPFLKLPKDMLVCGDLDIRGTEISELPDDLQVPGNLFAQGTRLTSIGNNVRVGKDLHIEDTEVAALPGDLSVGGSLFASNSKLSALPATVLIAHSIDLRSTPIESLPPGIRVGGHLWLNDCLRLSSLPPNLSVGDGLHIENTAITEIPVSSRIGKGLFAAGSRLRDIGLRKCWETLDLRDTDIRTLPDGIVIQARRGNGCLNLSGSAVERLGSGLRVYGRLDVRETAITEIPADLMVKGELVATDSKLESLPPDFRMLGLLDISGTPITVIPKGLSTVGGLTARRLRGLVIEDGLSVGGCLDLDETGVSDWQGEAKLGSVTCEDADISSMPAALSVASFSAARARIGRWPVRLEVGGDMLFEFGVAGTMPRHLVARSVLCEGSRGGSAPMNIMASGRVSFRKTKFDIYSESVTARSGDFRASHVRHLPAAWTIFEHLLMDNSRLETIESGAKIMGDFSFSGTPLRQRVEREEVVTRSTVRSGP